MACVRQIFPPPHSWCEGRAAQAGEIGVELKKIITGASCSHPCECEHVFRSFGSSCTSWGLRILSRACRTPCRLLATRCVATEQCSMTRAHAAIPARAMQVLRPMVTWMRPATGTRARTPSTATRLGIAARSTLATRMNVGATEPARPALRGGPRMSARKAHALRQSALRTTQRVGAAFARCVRPNTSWILRVLVTFASLRHVSLGSCFTREGALSSHLRALPFPFREGTRLRRRVRVRNRRTITRGHATRV